MDQDFIHHNTLFGLMFDDTELGSVVDSQGIIGFAEQRRQIEALGNH